MSAGSVALQVVTVLGSGLAGSLIGAYAQRCQYKQQKREDNRRLLWQYQRALADEGDYLTYPAYYGGAARYRKPEPEKLINAWNLAYVAIQELPAELRDDLTKDLPEFHTAFDHGDHLQWLARRLREYLIETQGFRARWASRARRLRASITPARKPVEVSSDTP